VLGLSNWRGVHVYRRRYADFPTPIIEKGRCLLWKRSDVEKWATRQNSIISI
jgi:predicted DNA-binding transcriptional regulator AlpA